jgi:2-C-methyl-D-erythritol 4-phosphate cytidylyltransferase/2-C-methyl-D-erythritol 2,4-cyclodiphosphate synthase
VTRKTYAVLLAGGSGTRFEGGQDKAWCRIGARPAWLHAALSLADHPHIAGIVLVARADTVERFRRNSEGMPKLIAIVPGGATRQQSCAQGVRALPPDAERVAVHDAARPNLRRAMLDRVLEPCEADVVVPAIPACETLKRVRNGHVVETLDRTDLVNVQTPQVAKVSALREALEKADRDFTDEASVVEAAGGTARVVEGDPANIKLTVKEDVALLEALMAGSGSVVRTGIGYDVHRLDEGVPLVLGGERIEHRRGLVGHSDGDVLTHAVCDALLGAAGMPDIGTLFPDTDPALSGIDSQRLLSEVAAKLRAAGWVTENIDSTVIAEEPKLQPHIAAMKARLSATLGVEQDRISVKATTNERLDALGAGQGIAAYAVATIHK